MIKINEYIDHTLLNPTATEADIIALCQEAVLHNFFSVCVNSSWVTIAKNALQDSEVKICAVVGFPLGAMSSEAKIFETKQAVADGASEIDMVLNIGQLKSKNYSQVEQEIRQLKKVTDKNILKVILETCYLSREEIILASELAAKAGADFIKTSSGFGPSGANEKDIMLMKNAAGPSVKIKASGGIKNLDTALRFIELGASRIGTSSGVSILKEMAV